MNSYTIILANRFIFSGKRGSFSISSFSCMSKQISKLNFQGCRHVILSDQKERPPEKVRQTNKHGKIVFKLGLIQLKLSSKSSTIIFTSRGRHLTGILTQESVCSVGLKAAWVGWSVCDKKPLNLLVTVRTLVLTSAVMYMRPLLSVWSVPHRLGTLATQRLWMFIIQSAEARRERQREIWGGLIKLSPLYHSEWECTVRRGLIRSHLMPWCMRP